VLDIVVDGIALWTAGTSATLIVGDATDPDGYYTAVNLKATDLLAGESISFALAGGKAGAYIANSQVSPRYAAAARTITASVTTVGTTATAGRTRITVTYVTNDSGTLENATYVAS
jgi:sigma54-dependent transcription regulator